MHLNSRRALLGQGNPGLSIIFEVGWDIGKIAGDLSCCGVVNMLVLYQSSQGYTSKYKGKIPSPWPLMTALGIT